MAVSLITRALSRIKPVKNTIKVYRGERADKDFRVAKEKQPKFNIKKSEEEKNFLFTADLRRKLGKKDYQEYMKKRDTAKGRFFTSDKEQANAYSTGANARLVEAEISEKDYNLGKGMLEKFFSREMPPPNTILLPRKNFKDVKEDIDFYKKKVGTIASTEYEKGGFIDMTKDKNYYKGTL